jgi:very-short-patch-repair endonuclease
MKKSIYSLAEKRDFARDMRRKPTLAEAALWIHLKGERLGYRFHRQSLQRGYILDFYCPWLKFGIEVDGSVHELEGQGADDEQKERALEAYGIGLLRFTNEDVLSRISFVLAQIRTECDHHAGLKALATGTTYRGIDTSSSSRRPCGSLQNSARTAVDAHQLTKKSVDSIPDHLCRPKQIPPDQQLTDEDYDRVNQAWRNLVRGSRARSLPLSDTRTVAERIWEQQYRLREYLAKKEPTAAAQTGEHEAQALTFKGLHVADFQRRKA